MSFSKFGFPNRVKLYPKQKFMAKLSREELLEQLPHFTGTEQHWHHPYFSGYYYTDGIRFIAQKAEAYWLLVHILSNQKIPDLKGQEFQVWRMKVADSSAVITVEDGDKNILKKFDIPFTDFPLNELTLWVEGNVLLLPSEH